MPINIYLIIVYLLAILSSPASATIQDAGDCIYHSPVTFTYEDSFGGNMTDSFTLGANEVSTSGINGQYAKYITSSNPALFWYDSSGWNYTYFNMLYPRVSQSFISQYQALGEAQTFAYLQSNKPNGCITCPDPEKEAAFLATCPGGHGNYVCEEPADSVCYDPCIAATDSCVTQCGGVENVLNFTCTDGVVTVPCECQAPPTTTTTITTTTTTTDTTTSDGPTTTVSSTTTDQSTTLPQTTSTTTPDLSGEDYHPDFARLNDTILAGDSDIKSQLSTANSTLTEQKNIQSSIDLRLSQTNEKLDQVNGQLSGNTDSVPDPPAQPILPEIDSNSIDAVFQQFPSAYDFAGPIKSGMDTLAISLKTHEPFASLSSVTQVLSVFNVEPHAPIITVTLPYIGDVHIDLSPWEPVAQILRAGISLLFFVGLLLVAVKIWT